MANKPTFNTFTSNSQLDVTKLNENFTTVADAIEDGLGRGGVTESPNSMSGNLDMNLNKIINLGAPSADNDAARLVDISDSDATGAASAQLRSDLANTADNFGVDLVANSTRKVNTYTDLKAITSQTNKDIAIVGGRTTIGDGGWGIFTFDSSDLSTEVTADSASGIYVAPDSDATGANGAWKRLHQENIVYLEWFGAIGDGVTDDTTAFQAVATKANAAGNLTVLGRPSATYILNSEIIITKSNVVFDFQGATLSGTATARITFNGDSGTDGDRSAVLEHCAYKNVHLAGQQRGPNMRWCDFPIIENVSRTNDKGTFINMAFSFNGTIKNIGAHNGDSTNDIGVLLLHCQNCEIDGLIIDGGGWVYGVQIKGGYGNKVRNSLITGITIMQLGFRDRGDAPWGASLTTGTYPYSTGAWGSADVQRASHGTIFENCWVVDCPNTPGFTTQEAIGTEFISCHSIRNATGFAASKVTGGSEADFKWIRCVAEDNGQRGFDISGPNTSELLTTVTLEHCQSIDHTTNDGLKLLNCDAPILINMYSCDNTGQNGINITDCIYPKILYANCCNNDRGVIVTLNTALDKFVTIENSLVENNTTENIKSWYPGVYVGNKGMPTVQTTDATVQDSVQRCELTDGKSYIIEVQLIGVGNSNRGVFRKTATVYATGGAATVQANVDNHADINPDTWGGLSFVAAADDIRLRITGKAADTIDWQFGDIKCVEIPFI